jgi:hypothetical protein
VSAAGSGAFSGGENDIQPVTRGSIVVDSQGVLVAGSWAVWRGKATYDNFGY